MVRVASGSGVGVDVDVDVTWVGDGVGFAVSPAGVIPGVVVGVEAGVDGVVVGVEAGVDGVVVGVRGRDQGFGWQRRCRGTGPLCRCRDGPRSLRRLRHGGYLDGNWCYGFPEGRDRRHRPSWGRGLFPQASRAARITKAVHRGNFNIREIISIAISEFRVPYG